MDSPLPSWYEDVDHAEGAIRSHLEDVSAREAAMDTIISTSSLPERTGHTMHGAAPRAHPGGAAAWRIPALALAATLFFWLSADAMDVKVDPQGQAAGGVSEEWLSTTIEARLIARGVPKEVYETLSVRVTTLGKALSLDAVLRTAPPRAFHKDIPGSDAVSGTLDEMIDAIFPKGPGETQPETTKSPEGPKAPATGEAPPQAAPSQPHPKTQEGLASVSLPFMPTSIASSGNDLFSSDRKTVYRIEGGETRQVWKAPGAWEILRLYPYEGSLLVLAASNGVLRTFSVRGDKTEKTWNKAVLPVGDGLVSTYLRFDDETADPVFPFSPASREAGSPVLPPGKVDPLSAAALSPGRGSMSHRIVSFDRDDRLTVLEGKDVLWVSGKAAGATPLFVNAPTKRERRPGSDSSPSASTYYVLRPRIVVAGSRVLTFRNEQGLGSMLPRLGLFTSSEVLAYEPTGDGFQPRVLARFPDGHCVDVAVAGSKAAVLVVEGKQATVRFLDLSGD